MSDETMPIEPEPTEPATAELPDEPATEPPDEPATDPDAPPRPAEPVSEPVAAAMTDPAGLSASEAAAAKRAETAAAVALVAAVASAKAEQAASVAVPEVVAEAAPKRPGRLRSMRGFVAMLIRGILVLALFIGGVALGQAAFRNSQTTEPTAIVDPATDGVQPPAVVRAFVGALGSGDADSVRSSLDALPHELLIDEFKRFDIQQITSVDVLSTHVDGPRAATEIVMQGTTTGGAPFSINLVVLSDGNTIEGFR